MKKKLLQEIFQIIKILENRRKKSYYTGLSDSTASKRAAQFKRQSEKPSDDPSAYKKAPGDSKPTSPSKWNKKFEKMYGESETHCQDCSIEELEFVEEGQESSEAIDALEIAESFLHENEEILEGLSEKTRTALKNKAKKANAPLGALTAVYNKGLAAWRTGHRPGASQHAWAMARVNSFLAGGPARKVDAAQWKQVQKHRKK